MNREPVTFEDCIYYGCIGFLAGGLLYLIIFARLAQ